MRMGTHTNASSTDSGVNHKSKRIKHRGNMRAQEGKLEQRHRKEKQRRRNAGRRCDEDEEAGIGGMEDSRV